MDFSADLIDDRLWLGSLAAMENTVALENLHITHILSLIESDLPIGSNDKFVRKHIRVEDTETTDLLAEFESCYEFIDKALSESPDNNVLLHCMAGLSSSILYANLISFSQVLLVVLLLLACGSCVDINYQLVMH